MGPQGVRAFCRLRKESDGKQLHSPGPDQSYEAYKARLRGVREVGRHLGSPAPVPHLRARRLLRFLEEQTRDKTLPACCASADSVDEPGERWIWCYVDELEPGELDA